jgi:hypothetical protein
MSNPFYSTFSSETPRSDALTRLALHWSWNHSTDEVSKRLAPELWETHRQSLGHPFSWSSCSVKLCRSTRAASVMLRATN